jgi:hypothetical protein
MPLEPKVARGFLADKPESQWRAVAWPTLEPVDIWAPAKVA